MFRPARSIWAVAVFMAGFTGLVTVLSHYLLIPALLATNHATAEEKARIAAYATLLLAVVLVIICVGILLVLRVKRFFVTTPGQRVKTDYADAWAEAGRRARPTAEDDDEPDDDPQRRPGASP